MDKRFDDWEHEVDCNDCAYWWNDACNGAQEAKKRHCTSFKATRSVVIPQKIKWLETRLKWLTRALIILGVSQLLMSIVILIYYFGIV